MKTVELLVDHYLFLKIVMMTDTIFKLIFAGLTNYKKINAIIREL